MEREKKMPWPQIRGYLIGPVVVVLKATVGMSKTHTHTHTHTQMMCFLPVKNSNLSVQISYGLRLWTAGLSCLFLMTNHMSSLGLWKLFFDG